MNLSRLMRNVCLTGALLAVPVSAIAAYVTSVVPANQNPADPANFVGRSVSVLDFGAKCDVLSGSGTILAGGLNTLTLPPSPPFTFNPLTDVGKHIVISGAAN